MHKRAQQRNKYLVMKTVIWGQKQMIHFQDILVLLGINYSDLTPTLKEKWNVQDTMLQDSRN